MAGGGVGVGFLKVSGVGVEVIFSGKKLYIFVFFREIRCGRNVISIVFSVNSMFFSLEKFK